jgi:hypothetical protein
VASATRWMRINRGWDLTQVLRIPGTTQLQVPEAPIVQVMWTNDLIYDPREVWKKIKDSSLLRTCTGHGRRHPAETDPSEGEGSPQDSTGSDRGGRAFAPHVGA